MLNKRELSAIRKALPEKGYEIIAEKSGSTKEAVRKVLSEPKRFNKVIIEKAVETIREFKQEVAELKSEIKQVIS